MIYTSFEYAWPRRADAKRIFLFFLVFFFARAIRQLSSRCTFVREFHGVPVRPSRLSKPFMNVWIYSPPAAPGGPWYPELKLFIPLYESYKYGQLFHSPSLFSLLAWVSQTGCGMPPMEWRIPLGVGRKRGVGFQVWVTVGRKGSRSCLFALWGWQRRGGGSSRVLWGHSLLSSHSQLLPGGLRGRTRVWNPMMYTPQARWTWSWMGDNEVDPVEYCWEKHCATLAARREWMNEFHVHRSAKNFPRIHKRFPIKLSSLNVTVSAVHTNPEFSQSHTVSSSVRWLKSCGDTNLFNLQSGDDVDLRNTIRSCRLEILKHNLQSKCWQRTLSFPSSSTLNHTLSATATTHTSVLWSIIYFIYFITVFLQLVHFAPQVFVFVLHSIQCNILSPITMSWKLLCWWHWNNVFTHQSNMTFGEIPSH